MLRLLLIVPFFMACSETSTPAEIVVEGEALPTPPVSASVAPDGAPVNSDPFSGLERATLPESIECHSSASEDSCDSVEVCCAETDCYVKTSLDSFRCRSLSCVDESRQISSAVCQ